MTKINPRVGVVDDDGSVRKALSRLLHASGFDVATFESAEDFLRYDNRHPVGCLVLDVRMPGIGGFGLQERLVAAGFRIPIIFITADDRDEVREHARMSSAVAYFVKPFDEEGLLEAINASLGLDPVSE